MKSIKNYIETYIETHLNTCLESILDNDDVYLSKVDKLVIKNWIITNYKIRGNLTISDDLVVDCTGAVEIKNKNITSLTNGLFRWGTISGFFDCSNCEDIVSLEGAPEKVGGCFDCNSCKKLTTLEGAPKKVDGYFSCDGCENLKTLEGAPEKVSGDFNCYSCKNLKITVSDRKKYNIRD